MMESEEDRKMWRVRAIIAFPHFCFPVLSSLVCLVVIIIFIAKKKNKLRWIRMGMEEEEEEWNGYEGYNIGKKFLSGVYDRLSFMLFHTTWLT